MSDRCWVFTVVAVMTVFTLCGAGILYFTGGVG